MYERMESVLLRSSGLLGPFLLTPSARAGRDADLESAPDGAFGLRAG